MVKGLLGRPPCNSAHVGTGEDGAAKMAVTADSHAAHYGGH